MLCHVAAFAGLIIPLGNILGPLVVWLLKRETYPLVDNQGNESLNFEISLVIYALVSAVLALVIIGIFLLIALGIFWVIVVIIGAIRANEGTSYRYPLCIRFLK